MGKKRFILGVIPARSGSKGIPNKNIVDLNGKPLISYTIKAAQKSKRLDDFFVSTDSEKIAAIAEKMGAKVPFIRPVKLAKDTTPTVLVLQHAIQKYEEITSIHITDVVLLQPTTPLRESEDIDKSIRLYLNSPDCNSLISCYDTRTIHPRIMYVLKNRRLKPFLPSGKRLVCRQKFEKVFVRNGAIYITSRDMIMKANKIVGESVAAYIMPRERSINIDDYFDLELARYLLKTKDNDEKENSNS